MCVHTGQCSPFSLKVSQRSAKPLFFMGQNRALHRLTMDLNVFLHRLVLVSGLPAENMYGTLTLVSLPLWVFCTLLLVGCNLAPESVWVCVCVSHHRGRRWMLAGLDSPLYCRGWLGLWSPASGWTKPKPTSKSLICLCAPSDCALLSYCARSNPVQLQVRVSSPGTESLGGFVGKKNMVLKNPVSLKWSSELCVSLHWAHTKSSHGSSGP